MKRLVLLGLGWMMVAGAGTASPASDAAAEDFIKNETQFHLGILPTEQSHPKTRGLSQVLASNPEKGVAMLLSVDDDIPPVAGKVFASPEFAKLVAAIQNARGTGHRVFFSGCGATGRLAILLNASVRRYAREKGDAALSKFTADIMTGGDYALVKSVEMFEDYITFGHQQAVDAGLAEGDVLVAISEGGETSSVIGTVLRGVEVGAETFFLFNNPPELLADRLERCRRVIRNPAVTVIPLCTGPMAVAGSTRMQATTIELLVAGSAMEKALFNRAPADTLHAFRILLAQLRTPENLKTLAAFVVLEEGLYRQHGRMTYYSDDWLLDIFTDTTERSPTFKLPPFRPEDDTVSPAPWTAVKSLSRNTEDTWLRVYEGKPQCLAWTPDDYIRLGASEGLRQNPPRITVKDLMAFRVGDEPDPSRTEVKPNAAMAILMGSEKLDAGLWMKISAPFEQRKVFRIGAKQTGDDLAIAMDVPETPMRLFDHLALKLVLNNVSSATMGKLGRLTSNWMSFVDASNKKLIDRSARLIVELVGVDYRAACHALYETFEEMKSWNVTKRKTVSPVAYTIEKLKRRKNAECPGLSWRIGVGDLKGAITHITPEQMLSSVTQRAPDSVTATWRGSVAYGTNFQVVASWKRGEDGIWLGSFSYSGYEGKLFAEIIRFPIVTRETDRPDVLNFVCGGFDIGQQGKIVAGKRKTFEIEGGIPILEVLPKEGEGYHFDFRDTGYHYVKRFTLMNNGTSFTCEFGSGVGAEGKPSSSYTLPFVCGFKQTKGSWFEGTQVYKAWSGRQAWSKPKTKTDKLRPIGMWVWNRGLITNAIPPVLELQKACGDVPIAVDWYWWHNNPYDSYYPDFWPPREGVDAFKATVADLAKHHIYSQVYVNGVCWDMDGNSWSEVSEKSAVFLRDGKVSNHIFNKYNHHRLANMCGGNTAFFDRLAGVINELAASGLDGVYTDMIGNSSRQVCYNPAHSHPKGFGAGTYTLKGFRGFVQRLQREHPGLVLTTETVAEDYIDLYDGGITCNSISNERMGGWLDPLPVFQSVHHGNGYALFGNYAHPDGTMPWDPLWPPEDQWKAEKDWNALFPVQFYYELGRTTIWGCQPMVCNVKMDIFTEKKYAKIRKFIVDTAHFYHDNLAFLYDGEMLSPEGFSCEEISVDFSCRMIFTKENQAKVITRKLPAIIHSCWKSPAGKAALFMVNTTAVPQPWRFNGLSGILAPHSYLKRGL